MPGHIAAGLAKQGLFVAATTIEVDGDYSRIQLFPYGEFRASDGRPTDAPHWIIADDNGEDICTIANGYKNKLVVDYEHQTIHASNNGRPAPAAGWMDYLYLTPKGLYAEVTWTDKAKEMIKGGEYKYISPVFIYDKDGYVRKILNAGLTNSPALDGMDQVVAACLECESLTDDLFPQNQPQKEETLMNPLLEILITALGLKPDASVDDAQAALTSLQTKATANGTALPEVYEKIAALSVQQGAEPDPAQYVPIATVAEMQTQIAALTVQHAAKNATEMVQAALTAGTLLPAQKQWAVAYCTSDPAGFASFVANAPPVAALTSTQTGGKAPESDGVALSPEQLAVCKSLDIPEAEFKQSLSET